MAKLRAAILGGTGYVGGELLRILSRHPEVEIEFVSSESQAGLPLGKVLPALRLPAALSALELGRLADLPEVDVVFACLPNGTLPRSLELIRARSPLVINLAGDYRLTNPSELAAHYPASLEFPAADAVYAIPELTPELPARGVINVSGCMSTTTIYALYPLLRAGLIEPYVVADLKTGSSGGGKSSDETPAERAGNLRPHKLHGHRHEPEISEALGRSTGQALELQFSTHSIDLPRGIYAAVYSKLKPGVTAQDVRKAYFGAYRDHEFVRYLAPSPHPHAQPMLKSVLGTNVVEVSASVENGRCVTIACLDNLIKGAAGQAVQVLDRVFNFTNTGYLATQGIWP
jgi:N-acetyl-gamma-glutamyl-phosphate reductase